MIGPKSTPNAIGMISDRVANGNISRLPGLGMMELLAATHGITIKRQINPAAALADHNAKIPDRPILPVLGLEDGNMCF